MGEQFPGIVYDRASRNVYWEMTLACHLACKHCRADAIPHRDPKELTTAGARAMICNIKEMGSMLILTGGDPMKRADLFELIGYARDLGADPLCNSQVAAVPAVG